MLQWHHERGSERGTGWKDETGVLANLRQFDNINLCKRVTSNPFIISSYIILAD